MKANIWSRRWWVAETDQNALHQILDECMRSAGFAVLDTCEYVFKPVGYTCMWLLGESHLAVHTFPERNLSYVELSSCNKKLYESALNMMDGRIQPVCVHEGVCGEDYSRELENR